MSLLDIPSCTLSIISYLTYYYWAFFYHQFLSWWNILEQDLNHLLLSYYSIRKMQNLAGQKLDGPMLFIDKIFKILNSPNYRNVISWNPDGTIFTICDQEGFCELVLPQHFKHKKIESFIRQLNIYGFKKVKKQISLNSFKHPSFLRDSPHLLKTIKRRVKSRRFYSGADDEESELKKQQQKHQATIVGVDQKEADRAKNANTACEISEEDGKERQGQEQDHQEGHYMDFRCGFQEHQNHYFEGGLFPHRSLTYWDLPLIRSQREF